MTTSCRTNEGGDVVGWREAMHIKPKPIYYSLIFSAISFNYFSPRLFHFFFFDSVFILLRSKLPNVLSCRQFNATALCSISVFRCVLAARHRTGTITIASPLLAPLPQWKTKAQANSKSRIPLYIFFFHHRRCRLLVWAQRAQRAGAIHQRLPRARDFLLSDFPINTLTIKAHKVNI